MPADTVTVRCPDCSRTWEVARRADGTFPAAARCAVRDGGCGRISVKVPRRTPAPKDIPAPAADVEWNPPSEPRGYLLLDEPYPHCGKSKVYASPRGTARVCLGCGKRVTPPGVLAPYERGTEVTRAAKSQRERDLEALGLAGRKGVMLGELRRLAADDRLDDASVMKAEWFAEQVKAAANGARLDELAGLFTAEHIRPRGWLQRPVSITAGYAEDGEPGEDDGGQAAGPARLHAVPDSTPAPPRPMTWTEAVSACGWRLSPTGGGCQVIDELGQHCAAETTSPAIPNGRGGSAWLCGSHYGTLGAAINDAWRQAQRETA